MGGGLSLIDELCESTCIETVEIIVLSSETNVFS